MRIDLRKTTLQVRSKEGCELVRLPKPLLDATFATDHAAAV